MATPAQSGAGFQQWFAKENTQRLFNGKRVFLFFDEFDELYQLGDDAVTDVLSTIRTLKNELDSTCLQSIAVVGPFSILHISGRSGSPFNVGSAFQVPFFTQEQVASLMSGLAQARGGEIEEGVAQDIWARTEGHPGLTCLCGKAIDEYLLVKGEPVSLQRWQRFVVNELPECAFTWPTMRKMVDTLKDPDTQASPVHVEVAKKARDLLLYGLLPAPGPVHVAESDIPLAEYLVSEGAAAKERDGRFRIRSDFVRTLVLSRVVRAMQRRVPATPFPFSTGAIPDVPSMLAGALPFFNAAHIDRAKWFSAKTVNGRQVAREAAYWAELFAVLSSWKPERLKLDVEYNKGLEGNQRCDLLFSSDDEVLAALELLASNQRKDILDHYDRVANYAAETGAREAWAVHFLAAESNTREASSGDFPASLINVSAVHMHTMRGYGEFGNLLNWDFPEFR